MRQVWGVVAVVLVMPWAVKASPPTVGTAYSNCKFGFQLILPAALRPKILGDNGFEIVIEERNANRALVSASKMRVLAARDPGQFALWQRNGKLLWTYRTAFDHGRTRFVVDWETVGGLLLLRWDDAPPARSGHMAHAQNARIPEVHYAALRRETSGEVLVYTFTLSGAAAATPWMRDEVLRQVLAAFQVLPLDRGPCGQHELAAQASSTPAGSHK